MRYPSPLALPGEGTGNVLYRSDLHRQMEVGSRLLPSVHFCSELEGSLWHWYFNFRKKQKRTPYTHLRSWWQTWQGTAAATFGQCRSGQVGLAGHQAGQGKSKNTSSYIVAPSASIKSDEADAFSACRHVLCFRTACTCRLQACASVALLRLVSPHMLRSHVAR